MATLNRTFSVKNGIDVANTIIVDSNRNVSNVANLSANTGTFSGNVNVSGTLITQNIIPAANVTFNLGSPTARFKDLYLSGSTLDLNGVQLSATADELRANTFNASVSFVSAGLNVLDQANTARTQANTAYGQANVAYGQANTARDQANTARDQANTARDQANSAYVQANAASASSNSSANTVRVSANGGSTLSGKQLNFVNTATALISVTDAADGNANITVNVIGGGAIGQAYDQANTARDTANAAYAQANAAYDQANTARSDANTTFGTINTTFGTVNTAITAAHNQANAARSDANTTFATINTTFGTTNTTFGTVNTTFGTVNTAVTAAHNQANAAYAAANLKLNLTGGTVSGDLTVQGNLFLTGNATYINVATLKVNDSIIQLSTNSTSDAVDIGFSGHYSPDSGTTNLHAGLVRHAADDIFYLFDGYGAEPTNNIIDVASANLAWLRANVNAAQLLLNGSAVATQANLTLAHNQANAAYGQANAARSDANTTFATINTTFGTVNTAITTANDQANAAYGQANAARSDANTTFGTINTTFGTVNTTFGTVNTTFGTVNTAVTAAHNQANTANDNANTRVLKSGDTMTGALTITTSGIGLSVSNANVRFSLQVNSLNVTTNTVTTSSSGQVVLDKFPTSQLASAKYFVQANSASDYQTTEIVLVQDATNVWLTEYGSIQTGPSLGTFTADISGGDVRLLFTAVNNINTIRSVRYGIIP